LGRRRVIDAFQQTRSPRNAPGNGKDPGDVAAAISARRRTRLAGSALLVAAAVNVVAGIGVGGWISLIVRHDMFAYCVAIGAWLGFAGLWMLVSSSIVLWSSSLIRGRRALLANMIPLSPTWLLTVPFVATAFWKLTNPHVEQPFAATAPRYAS
jgi:hypothetical protein